MATKKVLPRSIVVELPEDIMLRLVKYAQREQMTTHKAAADILIARLIT